MQDKIVAESVKTAFISVITPKQDKKQQIIQF